MNTKQQILKEYTKEDGIEMRLFVDLMIANKGNKVFVNKKLDELKDFISKAIDKAVEGERKRISQAILKATNGNMTIEDFDKPKP